MPIKHPTILTRQEFDQAMVHLRLSISEVSRDTGIPRTYLSEFRNGDRQLRPENLAKLRDYFESKGLEFEDDPSSAADIPQSLVTIDPHTDLDGIQRTMLAIRHLSIDPNIPQEQAEDILQKIAANDAEAKKLLEAKAENGFFSDWSESTDAMLKEVFGLFAANYVLLRRLQGRPIEMLEKPVELEQIKTVADIFAHLFHAENAPLAAIPPDEAEEQQEEAEA